MNEHDYAMVIAQVALLNCEVAGMQAENQQRAACGHSVAYGEDAFESVRKRYEPVIGYNAIISMRACSVISNVLSLGCIIMPVRSIFTDTWECSHGAGILGVSVKDSALMRC